MTYVEGESRRPLTGFSGVDLFLVDRSSGPVVRKQARTAVQNERLRDQSLKLAGIAQIGVSSPRVLDSGEQNGLFWFEMEYVPGETLGYALISGRDLHWPTIVEQIKEVLDFFSGEAAVNIPREAFPNKINHIVERCGHRDVLRPLCSQIERLAQELCKMDWQNIIAGPCHGDLTLENILVRHDGKLVFIDFDLPEQSSWYLDVGKMYQDVYGQWFLRKLAIADPEGIELINAQLNLARASTYFDDAFQDLIPGGRQKICQLAAFHLLRTLPYAVEATVPRYVVRRIVSLLGMR